MLSESPVIETESGCTKPGVFKHGQSGRLDQTDVLSRRPQQLLSSAPRCHQGVNDQLYHSIDNVICSGWDLRSTNCHTAILLDMRAEGVGAILSQPCNALIDSPYLLRRL